MWIMTKDGFYSAVKHRTKDHTVIVRARTEHDIKRAAKELKVDWWQDENADYRYRLEVDHGMFGIFVLDQAMDIDYDNFKNAVKDPEHKHAYMGVWSIMLRLQPARFMSRWRHDPVKLDDDEFDIMDMDDDYWGPLRPGDLK